MRLIESYLACAFVILSVASIPSQGQITAEIRGTVSDATGGVVPGAKLTVTNAQSVQ